MDKTFKSVAQRVSFETSDVWESEVSRAPTYPFLTTILDRKHQTGAPRSTLGINRYL